MVASQLVTPGLALGQPAVRQPAVHRHPPSVDPSCGPPLRLVVDNTGVLARPNRPPVEPVNLDRQRAGSSSPMDRIRLAAAVRRLVPVISVVAVVVLGGLAGLRAVQESATGRVLTVTSSGTSSGVGSVSARVGGDQPIPFDVSDSSVPAEPTYLIVHSGDSLWSLANTRFPERDPREVVDALADANGGSSVRPGQRLVIPEMLLGD